jgi:hypothetical protein
LFWANSETPFWADDYCRMIDAGVIEAVTRSWQEYFSWTGHFFTSAITYIVMSTGRAWGIGWFNLANSIIFLGLIAIVLRLIALATAVTRRVGGGCDPAACVDQRTNDTCPQV